MTRTPHDHRIRLADICLAFTLAIVALPFIVMVVQEYQDHAAWCKLPVKSIPCGEK